MNKLEEHLNEGKEIIVSITGLRIKRFWQTFRFFRHAVPCKIQAEKSPGNLYSAVKKINGVQHTLTAWDSKKSMLAYVHSPPHSKAIKIFHEIAEGKTCHLKMNKLPSWEEAIEIWNEQGKEYLR